MLQDLRGVLLITVHPEHIPGNLPASINTFLVTGKEPQAALSALAAHVGTAVPEAGDELRTGEYLIWRWRTGEPPGSFQVTPPRVERRRHHRKYVEGQLDADRSFYFRGPHDKLNLRAQNLILFSQIAEGVDEETWNHHLRNGDYSRWFRERIGDDALAEEAAAVERDPAGDTRARIREIIERHYTLPA
jgi:hypothetical protein